MKTIREHLELLATPYREKALKNTPKERLEIKKESLKESLACAFPWQKSKEGFKFWNKLFYKLITNRNYENN
jgi:hypothetical protein